MPTAQDSSGGGRRPSVTYQFGVTLLPGGALARRADSKYLATGSLQLVLWRDRTVRKRSSRWILWISSPRRSSRAPTPRSRRTASPTGTGSPAPPRSERGDGEWRQRSSGVKEYT